MSKRTKIFISQSGKLATTVPEMEILTYSDPLRVSYLSEANRRFGEIFCNNDGVFTYRCDFCPELMKHVSDVENHFFTHFQDIFQSKTEINSGVEQTKASGEQETVNRNSFDSLLCRKDHNVEDAHTEDVENIPSLIVDISGRKMKQKKDLAKPKTITSPPSTITDRKQVTKRQSTNQRSSTSPKAKRKKSTKPIINCELCDREFHCQTYLDKHIENHSFYPTTYECDICGKRVKERKDFTEHMNRAHIGIKYPCKVCGKEFAQSSYVQIHMRLHSQDRGHQCAVCGKTFFTSGALTSHMRKHNNTMNVLPCNICEKVFHLPGALADHLRVHSGEKPFKCPLCPNWFRTKKFLNQHKFVHLEVKQFACEVCGLKFKQASGKRMHKTKVHGKLVGIGNRCRSVDVQIT